LASGPLIKTFHHRFVGMVQRLRPSFDAGQHAGYWRLHASVTARESDTARIPPLPVQP
jgi:hypothetical protein